MKQLYINREVKKGQRNDSWLNTSTYGDTTPQYSWRPPTLTASHLQGHKIQCEDQIVLVARQVEKLTIQLNPLKIMYVALIWKQSGLWFAWHQLNMRTIKH